MHSAVSRGAKRVLPASIASLATSLLLAGCVAAFPIEQQAPRLSYQVRCPVVVAVIDDRDVLKKGIPPTCIGHDHQTMWFPMRMHVSGWLQHDPENREQTLAQAMEERIALALDRGRSLATTVDLVHPPTKEEIQSLLAERHAGRLLIVTLNRWFTIIGALGAFYMDWDYTAVVYDSQGTLVSSCSGSGRDGPDSKTTTIYEIHDDVILTHRMRLTKILERPELRAVLP